MEGALGKHLIYPLTLTLGTGTSFRGSLTDGHLTSIWPCCPGEPIAGHTWVTQPCLGWIVQLVRKFSCQDELAFL